MGWGGGTELSNMTDHTKDREKETLNPRRVSRAMATVPCLSVVA